MHFLQCANKHICILFVFVFNKIQSTSFIAESYQGYILLCASLLYRARSVSR